ncbi:hypothetical protein KKA33_01285 [Patescibacteria group bacterium]|nr:hypothetical protein [Patescibacteria group bacterium]
MSPLKPNRPDRQTSISKPKNRLALDLGKWGSRLAVLFILKGWLAIGGCATTPQVKPNAEAQDANPEKTLLRAIQAAEDGAQPDGSEVQFGEGATKEEAIANAEALVEMLLEGNLVFESHSFPLPDKRFLAVVRGKAEKKTGPDPEIIKERLLAQLNVKKDGAQPDGSEVQFGEGATIKEAADNAKALIDMLLEGKSLTYITHNERVGNKWIAVVRGVIKKPQARETKETDAKQPSEKELAAFYKNSGGNEAKVTIKEGITLPVIFLQIDQECIDHYVSELEKGPFGMCIGKALKRNPDRNYSGKMEVFVKVNNQGKAYRVTTKMKTKGFSQQEEKKIERCVIDNVKRWPLPKKPKGKRDQRNFSFELFF